MIISKRIYESNSFHGLKSEDKLIYHNYTEVFTVLRGRNEAN